MKTLEDLKTEVLSAAKHRPSHIRLGQFVFNYIEEKYGVARYVQFVDCVDCFYNDNAIDSFLVCCLNKINTPRADDSIKEMEAFKNFLIGNK